MLAEATEGISKDGAGVLTRRRSGEAPRFGAAAVRIRPPPGPAAPRGRRDSRASRPTSPGRTDQFQRWRATPLPSRSPANAPARPSAMRDSPSCSSPSSAAASRQRCALLRRSAGVRYRMHGAPS